MGQSSSYYTQFVDTSAENSEQTHQQNPDQPPPIPPKAYQNSKGRLPDSLAKILRIVQNECSNMLSIVKNIDEKYFEGAEGYLLQILKETENDLNEFNKTKKWPKAPEQESYKFLDELKKENKKLQDENRHLLGVLSTKENVHGIGQQPNQPTGKKDKERQRKTKADKKLIPELQEELDKLKASFDTQELLLQNLLERNRTLTEQKDELMHRLSRITGERLCRDNPAIADLSDPNRPTKLGEFYSELYDNEWTDAFESLVKVGYKEEDAIETLRMTLLNVIQFCRGKSEKLLEKTEQAINILFEEYKATEEANSWRHLSMSRSSASQYGNFLRQSSCDNNLDEYISLQERWKPRTGPLSNNRAQTLIKNTKPEAVLNQLKIFRKEVAEAMVPIVQKAYLKASWNDRENIYELKPFIKKCLFLGWMMAVQSPPMTLAHVEPGQKFDKNVYRAYSSSGNSISYVVWPALLLNQDGPIIGRGVAQGKK